MKYTLSFKRVHSFENDKGKKKKGYFVTTGNYVGKNNIFKSSKTLIVFKTRGSH